MIREVDEEVGCIPSRFRLLDVVAEPNPERHGPGEFHVFLVTAWGGTEPRLRSDEHDRLGWFSPAEAGALSLADQAYVGLFQRLERLLGEGAA